MLNEQMLARVVSPYRAARLARLDGVDIGSGVRVWGRPKVQLAKGARIIIADQVLLDSCDTGYHVSMYGPVKLIADSSGARLKIGRNSRIHGACIHAKNEITIGERCLIAANTQIMDSSGHPLSLSSPRDRRHEAVPREP